MKFSKFVAILAIISLAAGTQVSAEATATAGGTLRRDADLAQAEMDDVNSNGVVILNNNTNSNANTANAEQSQKAVQDQDMKNTATTTNTTKTVAQPTTIVEASPVSESKAEILRRERINAEVQTEQKIVERLEDSRLQEERARAERLFGPKIENNQTQVTVIPTQPVVVETPAVVVKPVQPIVPVVPVQPIAPVRPVDAVVIKEVNIENKAIIVDKKPDVIIVDDNRTRWYVSGELGNYEYGADNMKSNFGYGVTVGTMVDLNWAFEFSYFYSSHYIDTYWVYPVYSELDQNDFSLTTKYYFMANRFRPFVGGSASYITREYTDRIEDSEAYYYNDYTMSEDSQAVNLGVLGGADFFINRNFSVGGLIEYSFNVMNTNPIDWNNTYGIDTEVKDVEEISAWIFKFGARYTF